MSLPSFVPRSAILAFFLSVPAVAIALPPGQTGSRKRGANHVVGNASIKHRAKGKVIKEKALMRAHLSYIRRLLGSGTATSPKFAKQRRRLLGYLDDYIARGVTPRNLRLPWRNPVFIDGAGRICAVGYLIERSVGRPFAETIAKAHRYDYLEDIAAAMPKVRAWIATSGFTLRELSSIQPGYMEPLTEEWGPWDLREHPKPNGKYTGPGGTRGTFARGRMAGKWTRTRNGKVVGSGTFKRGAARWRSVYPSGKRLAVGRYVNNVPHGSWRFYHESGRLAARGSFRKGFRHGRWRFYYDSSPRRTIAVGRFATGSTTGVWRHYDARGKLIAIARPRMAKGWTYGLAFLLDVKAGRTGVRHQIHQGSADTEHRRLDMIVGRGSRERLYIDIFKDRIWDRHGNRLAAVSSPTGVKWTSAECKWSRTLSRAAGRGDLPRVHALIRTHKEDEKCGAKKTVSARRARRLQRLTLAMRTIRAQAPNFVRRLVLANGPGRKLEKPLSATVNGLLANPKARDLAKILAANMTWYIEWPHIDGRFYQVLSTMPGFDAERTEG